MAWFSGVVFGFSLMVLLQCALAQTVHVVGDGMGWNIPSNGAAPYSNWARGKNFVVGDMLLFNFTTNAHDVVQVPKASYDACTGANPIGDIITTGPVTIAFNTAGDHYYICTFSSHCQLGQKLAVTVSSSSTSTPRSSPAPPTTTPTTPSSKNNAPAPDCPTSKPPTTGGPTISPSSAQAPGSSSSKVLAQAGVSVFVMVLVFGFLF